MNPQNAFWKWAAISLAVFVVCAIGIGAAFLWARGYTDRLPPNVSIGEQVFGGWSLETTRAWLDAKADAILTEGIPLIIEGEEKTLSFATLGGDVVEDVQFDIDTTMQTLVRSTYDPDPIDNVLLKLRHLWKQTDAAVELTIDQDRVKERVRALFPGVETLAQNATFSIESVNDSWDIGVAEATAGREFQWKPFFEVLQRQLTKLDTSTVTLTLADTPPTVSQETALAQVDAARAALTAAPYRVTAQRGESFALDAQTLATMLAPGVDGNLTLNETVDEWIQGIVKTVDRPAQDARLTIEGGRVVDFLESREGRAVDVESLKADVLDRIRTATNDPIELAIKTIEPSVKTSDVNDLGIDEVLGVGTSSYRGSPVNRRANIQNGVDLLNGRLIAPGETFSLLAALAPFTTENGYLPELVIKGDKITPEIGGGLCQIGTTTFRASMNSGLPIVERQNHSIVVSYYNDPSNGNPGTDATIYEPAPDFKFTNDTTQYILFQAENVIDTQELRFTFWGTSDGRKGFYTPPVVSQWIPVGETVRTPTTDLPPDEEKCQSAHVGANASFDYTVGYADGRIVSQTFESHYRPLPEICLVGVTPESLSTESLAPSQPTDVLSKNDEGETSSSQDLSSE